MASFSQHINDRETKISVKKLWDNEDNQLVCLIIEGNGVENTIFMDRVQLEEIAGKTMAYLLPELQPAQ